MRYLSKASHPSSLIGIHVAIFSEPFLSLVLSGKKTVESRLSKNRCAPFQAIDDGDIILVKAVSGPICGLVLADKTWFYDLSVDAISCVKELYGEEICADENYWEGRRDAAYATCVALLEPLEIKPLKFDKRDRRGWVTLRSRQLELSYLWD